VVTTFRAHETVAVEPLYIHGPDQVNETLATVVSRADSDSDFSDDFCRFLQKCVANVDAAELLLALFNERLRWWQPRELAARLAPGASLSEADVQRYLDVFQRCSLVVRDAEQAQYRPAVSHDPHVALLARLYVERPVTLFRVIHEQLYSSLEREIARAKDAEEKLQQASQRKDEFLAMLSHELRNPLAPIVTAAQVLGKIAPSDARIAWVREVIERQVTHLAGLVDDLLDVSRITQGKITLHREAVELNKVLEHSLEIVRPLVDSKRHSLSIHLPETPIWVFGDFSRLSQIFSNVLHNAAKYTSDGGGIELTVAVDRGSVAVRVRDNGIGIDSQFLPHVFEVFTQGYRGLDRSQGGLGVGLAVVRRLVELHQGEVSVSSEGPGFGTEVSVQLPCISEVVPHAGVQVVPVIRQGGKRILVVDDNADAGESIAVFMRIEGHEVRTVTDAMQALDCFEAFAPDVAIIDIGLPGMNGYELAASIRANTAVKVPVMIALTGYGQAEDFDRSRDAGFDHHFVKPADLKTILAVIDCDSPAQTVEERRTLV
jgi:signal transduction histidine kinase/ActR/RegA family two-component response regulator